MEYTYLQRYNAAAEVDKFPLVYQWMREEPLPFFKELREKQPILVTPEATLITRFDDITRVLDMPHIFTTQLYWPKMANGIYVMTQDNPLHSQEHSIMQNLLNLEDLPLMRQRVAEIGKDILDTANGNIEIVNAFCRMVPATLVQDYFGFTGIDKEELIEWSYWGQYHTRHNQPFELIPEEKRQIIEAQQARISQKLGLYITELLARRSLVLNLERNHALPPFWSKLLTLLKTLLGKQEPALTDDVVTRMLRQHFSEAMNIDFKQLGVNIGDLLVGAVEITSQAVVQVIHYLLQHPKWLTKARNAAIRGKFDEFDGIVWETLRFVPTTPYLFRKSTCDCTIGLGTNYSTTIPAGTYVLPVTQSALFDAQTVDKPDEFIPTRNWLQYFHFSFGSHEYLSRYVGMVMIPEMVRQVFLRNGVRPSQIINYTLDEFPEEYHLTWH